MYITCHHLDSVSLFTIRLNSWERLLRMRVFSLSTKPQVQFLSASLLNVFVGLAITVGNAINMALVFARRNGLVPVAIVHTFHLFPSIVSFCSEETNDFVILCSSFCSDLYRSEDVNECALGIDDCDPLVQCINYPGGYNCTSCPPGYYDVYGNGTFCQDINECATHQYNCSPPTPNCTNIPGSYVCTSCPSGYLPLSQGCTSQYCGNGQVNPGEQCDGGFRCLPNCTCAPGFGPTPNVSLGCVTACGNGRIDPGEECDGGIGCDSSCLCNRTLGYVPNSPPTVNCLNMSFAYSDSCVLHNGNCSDCTSFNCLFCSNSSECHNARLSPDCQTFCPVSNNDSFLIQPKQSPQTLGGMPTNLMISVIVVAGALSIGVFVFVLIFYFHRKKRKQRSQDVELTISRTALRSTSHTLWHSGSLASATEEWTPPSESTFAALNDLPVKFSKGLDFNIGKNQFQVNERYVDVLVITLKEGRKDEVTIEFHPSINSRYEIEVEPQTATVKKGKETEVKFTLTVTMTTEVECPIGINLPQENLNSKIIVKIVSEPSPFIDFDELVIDSQKPIGDGGFGIVYRGQYRGTDAAIKILKVQELPDDALEEFTREIDLMAKLRHKNIVQFLGASCIPGKFAIVTEFIEFGSVSSAMKKNKFSYALKLKIACDAARALNFLHKNKIIHRDLKLENLLLVSMSLSAPVNAKLTDFGASRAVSEKTSNKYTVGIGTPLYMAPEVLRREPYDLSSDIYGFGMMLWALMAEREPWSEYTHAWEIANLVIAGKREEIPALWPSAIVNLIRRCWAHNPRDRPEAKEICQILQTLTTRELQIHNAAKVWK
jgi:tRNA A-37 threonylcarbamoyl transferase component Bud32